MAKLPDGLTAIMNVLRKHREVPATVQHIGESGMQFVDLITRRYKLEKLIDSIVLHHEDEIYGMFIQFVNKECVIVVLCSERGWSSTLFSEQEEELCELEDIERERKSDQDRNATRH